MKRMHSRPTEAVKEKEAGTGAEEVKEEVVSTVDSRESQRNVRSAQNFIVQAHARFHRRTNWT